MLEECLYQETEEGKGPLAEGTAYTTARRMERAGKPEYTMQSSESL